MTIIIRILKISLDIDVMHNVFWSGTMLKKLKINCLKDAIRVSTDNGLLQKKN